MNAPQANRIIEKITFFFDKFGKQATQALLIVYLLLGILILPDYGISIDEPIERKHGMVNYDYINKTLGLFPEAPPFRNVDLRTYDHREYGVTFQLVSFGLELLLGIKDARQVFILRHFVTFSFFCIGCYFFAHLLFRRFKHWGLSFIGLLFLILSPRIFANAFYNPKDIIFLSWVIISMYSCFRLLEEPKLKFAILHGIACGLAIATRITGIYLIALTFGILALQYLVPKEKQHKNLKKLLLLLSFYSFTTILTTYLIWPYMWENPIEHFQYAFLRLSQYPWRGQVFYLGKFYSGGALPWHYIPVMIGITTPLLYSVLFVTGVVLTCWQIIRRTLNKNYRVTDWMDLTSMGYLFTPIIAVIVLNSVLYNGWRHLYFIYPAFLLIAGKGLQWIWALINSHPSTKVKQFGHTSIAIILGLTFIYTAYTMTQMHPHQQVYTNWLTGKNTHENFELDYFGLSYKEALSFLLATFPDQDLYIHTSYPAGEVNKINFSKEEATRLKYVNIEEAKFLITNYYYSSSSTNMFNYLKGEWPFNQPKLFIIKWRNSPIIGIYKMP